MVRPPWSATPWIFTRAAPDAVARITVVPPLLATPTTCNSAAVPANGTCVNTITKPYKNLRILSLPVAERMETSNSYNHYPHTTKLAAYEPRAVFFTGVNTAEKLTGPFADDRTSTMPPSSLLNDFEPTRTARDSAAAGTSAACVITG
jgi:hypothetical protein